MKEKKLIGKMASVLLDVFFITIYFLRIKLKNFNVYF